MLRPLSINLNPKLPTAYGAKAVGLLGWATLAVAGRFAFLNEGRSMADDKAQSGGQDRTRINMNEDYEVEDWTKPLGVSRERLQEAVDAVGDQTEAVRAYLRG